MAAQAAAGPMVPVDLRPKRRWTSSLLRIARKKPVGAASAIICVALILVALGADVLAPQAANQVDPIKNPRLLSPSLEHPFGTDNLFRDVFSRVIIGSRISLGVGFMSVFIGTIIGTTLGMVSGYFRGKVDLFVSRLMEVVLVFPPLVLAIFFLAIFNTSKGYSFKSFLLLSAAIGIIIAPTTARIV